MSDVTVAAGPFHVWPGRRFEEIRGDSKADTGDYLVFLGKDVVPTRYPFGVDYKNRPRAMSRSLDGWILATFEPFKGLQDLGVGWDGVDSVPVTPFAWETARRTARRFAERLPQLRESAKTRFKLVPSPEGGIDMIWRTPTRTWEFTVEIPPKGSSGLWYTAEDGDALHQGDLEVNRQFEDAVNFLSIRIDAE